MVCQSCGKELADNANFCPDCGTSTSSAPAPAPAPTPIPAQPAYIPAPQAVYVQPAVSPSSAPLCEPVSVGSFVGMFILQTIPLVGLIMLIVWACDSNKSKKNYAIASFIMMLIAIGIGILITILGGLGLAGIASYIEENVNTISCLM